MSNIDFIENLVRRFQPGLLGPQEDNSPLAGDIYGAPKAPSLPQIGITGREPNTAFDAPAVALPAVAPDGAPNKYAGLVNSLDQLPAIAPGQPTPLPDITPNTTAVRQPIADEPPPPIAVTPVATPATDASTVPTISPILQAEQDRLTGLFNKDYSPGQYRRADGTLTSHPTTKGGKLPPIDQLGAISDASAAGNKYDPSAPIANEIVQAPGKDRAQKWSLRDKILNAIEGWATGGLAEGIRGATDRNYQAKLKDQSDIARLLPQINAQQQIEARNAATAGAIARPAIARDELQRKAALDAAREKYWTRRADQNDLKQATQEDLIQLRDKWMTSKDVNDKRRLDVVEKELGERVRHNQVSEKQASTNEIGRNTRFGTAQQNQMTRQQIGIAANKAAADLKAAVASGQMERAAQLRKELEDYKSQLTLGSTPQQ
jgi:hypothetical protein